MKKIFTVLGIVAVASIANAQIVINEVYGGGGNGGATHTHDFIELINRGTAPVTLTGATLQYASATGTFNVYQELPTITLAPGQTYLVQEAEGNGNGVALPTPDFIPSSTVNFANGQVGTTGFAMQGSNVKVALAQGIVQVATPTDSHVIDFVGTGTANQFEGTVAGAMSNSTSASRTNGVDTNNNGADFTIGTPTPQNSTTGNLAVSDVKKVSKNFVKNTLVKNNEIVFGSDVKDIKVYTLSGAIVKTGDVKNGSTLNVAELAKGNYIVTGIVNNEPVSQKILKD